MVLKRQRGRADAFIHVTGRDIEEEMELALRWNSDTAGWAIIGNAEEYRISKERAEVVGVLDESSKAMTPTEVADALGENANAVKVRMWRMANDGQLASEDGRYSVSNRNPGNPETE
jgi:hypothetical protein